MYCIGNCSHPIHIFIKCVTLYSKTYNFLFGNRTLLTILVVYAEYDTLLWNWGNQKCRQFAVCTDGIKIQVCTCCTNLIHIDIRKFKISCLEEKPRSEKKHTIKNAEWKREEKQLLSCSCIKLIRSCDYQFENWELSPCVIFMSVCVK